MRILLSALLLFCFFNFNVNLLAQTYSWNGSISSNWGTSSNWTPNGIPGAGSTVQINSAAMPNPCQLDANRTISTLTVSAGTLNLGGFQLTCSTSASFTGGTVQSGTVSTASFSAMANTTFSGTMALRKTGGTNNDLAGGNTFNGPVTFTQNGSRRLRLADTNGDTYNSSATFVNSTTRDFDVAYNGTNTFSGNLTITNSGSGGITLAANNTVGATVTIASGSALLSGGFTNGPLTMYRVTQNGTAANGSFSPTDFTAANCSFGGNFSVSTTAGGGTLSITSCAFRATNSITAAGRITLTNSNSFSTVSGSSSIANNGGGTNETWTGGNNFRNVTISNTTSRRIRMANTTGDTYTGTATFVNTNSGVLEIGYSGTNSFDQNITLNNSGTGGINFGANGGTSTLANGALITSSFTNGPLTISNFTQSQVYANSAMNPSTFSCTTCSIKGNFSVTTSSGDITLATSSFTASNSFTSSAGHLVTGANSFSTVSGSTSFTKNGGAADLWAGGNTFGPVTFTNNSTVELRLASTSADTYTGSATFVRTSTGALSPAYAGNNNFAGDVSTVGTTTAITFGGGSGRVILNGSSTQNLYGSATRAPIFSRLSMSTSANGKLVLNVPLNISTNLTMTTGNIVTTATNILTLTDETTSTTVGNANSYVEGPMQYTLNSNSITRSTLNFPIGKGSDWRPVSLRVAHSTTTSYTYRSEVLNQSAWDLGWTLPVTAQIVSGVRYWDIGRYLTSTMVSAPSVDLRTTAGQEPEITLHFGLNDGVVRSTDGAETIVLVR